MSTRTFPRAHLDSIVAKYLSEEPRARGFSEAPVVRIFGCDPAKRGYHAQKGATGPENAMRVLDRGTHVEDVLKSLRQDETVERLGWQLVRSGEICDEGGVRIPRVDVENVAPFNIGAKAARIARVLNLKHSSPNKMPVLIEKLLDVVAVDRGTMLVSPIDAQRLRAAYRA